MCWVKTSGLFLLLASSSLLLTACSSDNAVEELEPDNREITSTIQPSEENTIELPEELIPQPLLDGPDGITDLILITGQSNALGSLTGYDPELDSSTDRFYAFTDQGWQRASLKQVWDLGWHPRTEPDTDPHNNFGMHFGKRLTELNPDRVVGIVLVTAPGEGISHWDADGYFFNKIRTKALTALNALPHKSQFDGILWHQGETDWSAVGSLDPEVRQQQVSNDYYSNKLWELITNFRNESWFSYTRPFICGETAQSPVNSRLMALNRDNDYWTACVAGSGLPTYDDARVHFSASALRELGSSYAEAYLHLHGL